MDLVLCPRVESRALPDVLDPCILVDVLEDVFGDEAVPEHDVGATQHLRRAYGQQSGISRTSPHEEDFAHGHGPGEPRCSRLIA